MWNRENGNKEIQEDAELLEGNVYKFDISVMILYLKPIF